MARKRPAKKARRDDRATEYVRGGKGRTDDVRGSRIYPIDAPNAPANAEIVGAGELGEGPRARLPVKGPTAALAKRSE
jgi:hypothetical protein